MEKSVKILDLDNQIIAQVLSEVLKDRNIPHLVRSFHDSAYDGVFQVQHGWGQLETTGRSIIYKLKSYEEYYNVRGQYQ